MENCEKEHFVYGYASYLQMSLRTFNITIRKDEPQTIFLIYSWWDVDDESNKSSVIYISITKPVKMFIKQAGYLFSGGNEEFCCDEKQVELLDAQMTLPRQFLSRCPSCLTNFVQLWCDFTCSPNQADFVRIITSTDDLYLV